MKGKLIVLYGINNLGKTTQAKLTVEELKKQGIQAEYLKYATYDLEPSGMIINDYFRNGDPYKLSARELQIMQAFNRTQYEPILKSKLEQGIWIVAEDYTQTGIAWGAGNGIDKEFLERINSHLLKEDLVFFFEGERFKGAIEKGHQHENNEELTQKVKLVHEELAKKHNWISINANESIESIQKAVQTIIKQKLQM